MPKPESSVLSVRDMNHHDYQCPSESRHVKIMPSGNVDSEVVEDVNILLEITTIVEDTLVDSVTLIIDEVQVSSNSYR